MTPTQRRSAKARDNRRRRDARKTAGLCMECGKPAAVRVILDAGGREIRRKTMGRCKECL